MHILVVVDSLICKIAFGSYISISSHSRSNCSRTLAMRIAPSVLKLKLRSKLISTSGPTASRNVPISSSI